MQNNPITNQILEALDRGSQVLSSLNTEAREQFLALLESQVNQMDVVSRAEFEALRNSLNRANQRIEELEARLTKTA